MDVTEVRGVTDLRDLTDRSRSLKIFLPKQKAPLLLGALFVNQKLNQKLKLSH